MTDLRKSGVAEVRGQKERRPFERSRYPFRGSTTFAGHDSRGVLPLARTLSLTRPPVPTSGGEVFHSLGLEGTNRNDTRVGREVKT